nr:putative ribonuclease H-like domain-containing protein [Tanacetum cinerariifolium]
EAEPSQNDPSFVQPFEQTPKPSVQIVEHAILADHSRKDFPKSNGHRNSRNRKACFVSLLTRAKLVPLTAARPVTAVVPHNNVIRPRLAKNVGTKLHSPPRRTINRRPSPPASNFPLKVTTVKAPKVNTVKGVQGNWICCLWWKSKSGKIIGKGKIKTDTECIVLSPEFKLPDENQVLLRVPRENNMYNVDLKNIVPSGGLTCLFAKATLNESNLWHRRLGHINFKTMNKVNTDGDANFEVKELESEVYVSLSSSAKTKKHDDKNKREANGKSHVELSTGYRNLSEEFEDFSDNNINEVNAASIIVPAGGQISTNSTNTFSAAGPSNTAVSPTHGKSLYVDPSQYPDDPNMPALEDISYSDDKEDVGAEVDFTNLETTITEENIDYEEVFAPVSRIEAIRLFLAYASFMGFMVYQMDVKSAFLYGTIKEDVYVCQPPRFEDLDYPDKVYKVVKALYGLH